MSRSLKVRTVELGVVETLIIRQENGQWEPEWEALRKTPAGALITVMPRAHLEHALHGWSAPFSMALSISPWGALRKLRLTEARECLHRSRCASYLGPSCSVESTALPKCFEPVGLPPIAQELVRLWHESVYVIAVIEET